jgi:hypothetical protein
MRKLVVVAGLASLLSVLLPSAGRAGGGVWQGRWQVEPGPIMVLVVDGRDVGGRWDCHCENSKKAIVGGRLHNRGGVFEGAWHCADHSGKGSLSLIMDADLEHFSGSFTVKDGGGGEVTGTKIS